MFDIPKLTESAASVKTHSATIADLEAQQARANTDANAGDSSARDLIALRQRRADAIGQAYIAGTTADTKAIDAQIAKFEKASADAQAKAEAARNALPLLGQQLEASTKARHDAHVGLIEEARRQARAAYAAGMEKFLAATEQLRAITAETDAAARMSSELSRRLEGRVSNEANEWANGVLKNLKLPVIPGGAWSGQWWPEDAYEHANERARPHFDAATQALAGVGIEIYGGTLRKQAQVAVAAAAPAATGVSVQQFPPDAPVDLVAVAGNTTTILKWRATGAQAYRVKRSTQDGGPYKQIAETDSQTFTDTGLENDTAYFYTVQAVNQIGASRNSTQIAVTPSPTGALQASSSRRSSASLPGNEMARSLSQAQGEGALGLVESVVR